MLATASSHATAKPAISFGSFREAWRGHAYTVQHLIERSGAIKVCELGGGANPTLSRADRGVKEARLHHPGYRATRARQGSAGIQDDRSRPATRTCVSPSSSTLHSRKCSRSTCETGSVHRNVFRLLRPGGIAFHFFPTLWAPPFVANLLLPERVSATLLNLFSPRDGVRHGKFPARYSWCRGPTPRQFDRFRSIGYEIIEYRGFFGHDYYRRIPIARWTAEALADYLERNPAPALTSFAQLCLRRPTGRGAKR